MNTMQIAGGKVQTAYAKWVRNLAVLAAALGLAGSLLVGSGIVNEPQSASAASELDLFKLEEDLKDLAGG